MTAPRIGMCALALVNLALALGLFLHAPWATAMWPWTEQPLDYTLLAGFLAAGFGAVLWIALTAEWGALVGALLDVGLFNLGAAAWLWSLWFAERDSAVLVRAIAFTVGAGAELAMLRVALRHPVRDTRPADRLLVVSFWVFALVLLASGAALLAHLPVWPWPLAPRSSTLIGLLFLGSAVYFLHGLYKPTWHGMKGQLVAFLLYDLVLVQPYANLGSSNVYDLNYASLAVYLAVIAYSGCLAAYYLFMNPRTKGWAVQA